MSEHRTKATHHRCIGGPLDGMTLRMEFGLVLKEVPFPTHGGRYVLHDAKYRWEEP